MPASRSALPTLRHDGSSSSKSHRAPPWYTQVQLRVCMRYVLATIALCVVVHVALFDVAHRVLTARYVNGKRCEAISPVHVESAFYNPEDCFSRTDIQHILVGLVWAIHDVFERHDLHYWLDSGTLLGARREQTAIPYDTDADIGVDAATFAALRNRTYTFPSVYELNVVDSQHYNAGTRDAGIPGRLIHTLSGLYVDIFVFHDVDVNATAAASSSPVFGPVPSVCFNGCYRCPQVSERAFAFAIPKTWVFPLQRCSFGGRVVNCPAEADKYLDYLYGPDYLTPDK